MTSTKSFAVVEFPEEDSVEVVSVKWLINDNLSCYWPSAIGTRLKRLITNHADPQSHLDSTIIWNLYQCRLLKCCGK